MSNNTMSIDSNIENEMKLMLNNIFKLKTFRPKQVDIIKHIICKKSDCISIMPTGSGKSLLYQFTCIYLKSIVFVVSPLIALMENQVKLSKVKAICIHSSLTTNERKNAFSTINDASSNKTALLVYVTPEFLCNEDILKTVSKMILNNSICLFAIDESHCISEWGHTFRPAYLQLNILKEKFPNVPILAVTATASKYVTEDILKSLKIPKSIIFRGSLDRPNIYLKVKYSNSRNEIASQIQNLLKQNFYLNNRGIVYCSTRKRCTELVKLCGGVEYHAGMSIKDKSNSVKCWDNGDILFATEAFGMGIDSPDVRFIIHDSIPSCLESYYQQVGRAGRDGKDSEAILFYDMEEVSRRIFFEKKEGKPVDKGLFKSMKLYGEVNEINKCRRKILLDYFGDSNIQINDKCCDLCDDFDKVKKEFELFQETNNSLNSVFDTKSLESDYKAYYEDDEYRNKHVSNKRNFTKFESSEKFQSVLQAGPVILPKSIINVKPECRDKNWSSKLFNVMIAAEEKIEKKQKVLNVNLNIIKNVDKSPVIFADSDLILEPRYFKNIPTLHRENCVKKLSLEIIKNRKMCSIELTELESLNLIAKFEYDLFKSNTMLSISDYNDKIRTNLGDIREYTNKKILFAIF